ncbi:MAG: cardiolipin synthase [Oscillospiraceae bacterium]|nr:cardiolipin synthase [Oscillospiraceae bacterium]
MLRKLIRILFNRNTVFILMMLVQVAFLVVTILFLSQNYWTVYLGLTILNIILVVYISNTSENPDYKLPWMIAMLVFPLFAGLAYLLVKTDTGHRVFKKNYARRVRETKKYLPQDAHVAEQIWELDTEHANLSRYLMQYGGYPVYRNYQSEYFPIGEEMFEVMKREIKKAKYYIFLEFFIIDHGTMWDELLELLKEKAAEGIDIRLMYDGFGTEFIMPMRYFTDLEKFKIHCRVFNHFKPFLSSSQNNRDHRKILVIDGHTAFTGGINIADEYVNRKVRFGHWKDGGMMCRGEAAWSFVIMFLQLWNLEETDKGELERYKPKEAFPGNYDGFIQPYGDSPTDGENVGKSVYLDIINNAQDYVYIMTPYLILDHEMITALGLAAKKGVDVRILTPHIPDKWYVYSIAWGYYQELLEQHVRIFEYEPGFVHAKNFSADDRIGVVGTINLDYRSLYLHFECAAVLYHSKMIQEIRMDFETCLKKSIEISLDDCKKRSFFKRIVSGVLRIFAPLL